MAMADATQLPLLAVVLCCTSIPPEQRSNLAACAEQMGAVHKLDLTSDVTHLIVGDTDTPKYRFVAKERVDVKCLLPSWIEAVRDSWLEGGETDVGTLEVQHKLPTFVGLKICVTGFRDLAYRKELEETVSANGAEYRANLTPDVTHLIAKDPSGGKYKSAKQWGLKIVSIEWLEQSRERGMILEETLYHPLIPPTERGQGAWVRRTPSNTSLGKRTRENELAPQNSRKLRRTASAKLESQNSGLWTDIVAREPGPGVLKRDSWDEGPTEVIDGKTDPTVNKPQNDSEEKSMSTHNLDLLRAKSQHGKDMFRGTVFMSYGFDDRKTSIIQGHLHSHGAQVIDLHHSSALPDIASYKPYLLIPHTLPASDVPNVPSTIQQPVIVTELWLERCLYRKGFEDPKARITSTPFSFPIAGFEDFHVCSTAFQGIELLHMSKAVKLIGAKYEEYFDPNASVLVCNSATPGLEKLRHAQLWRVPAVRADWLWDCIRKGELMPFGPYLIQPIALAEPNSDLALRGIEAPKKVEDAYRKQSNKAPPDTSEPSERLMRKNDSVENEYRSPKKDTSSVINTTTRRPDPFPDDIGLSTDIPEDSAKLTDFDSNDTFTDLNPTSSVHHPLREITPNSSPPKQADLTTKPPPKPPPKPISTSHSPTKPPTNSHPPSPLGPQISSLLAHHQRNSKNSPKPPPQPADSAPRRRRRQLLGRAPSNPSTHSAMLSRASSVDTTHTDGLGTPVEISSHHYPHSKLIAPNTITTATTTNPDEGPMKSIYDPSNNDDDDEKAALGSAEALQMTQLGYEDPDVAAWRERVTFKMGGGVVGKCRTEGRVKEKERERDGKKGVGVGEGGGGIARRTRGAGGR